MSAVRSRWHLGSARSITLIVVALAHGVFFYELAHMPTARMKDGPALFGPVIAEGPPVAETRGIRSRPYNPQIPVSPRYRERLWHFPRAEVWPLAGRECAVPTEFSPFMDADPVTDASEPKPNGASKGPTAHARSEVPRMVLWLRPTYTPDWAGTEQEGTTRLALKVRSNGTAFDVHTEASSGSQKLDEAAVQAAQAWRFAPASWQGQPVESQITVELAYRFFEYHLSRLEGTALQVVHPRRVVPEDRKDRRGTLRRQLEQLRTGTNPDFLAPAAAAKAPEWPAAMRDWGSISGIQDLGPVGPSQWERYAIDERFRKTKRAKSALVRWEALRVQHGTHVALWQVALDRAGSVWAVKAAPLDTSGSSESSAPACNGVQTAMPP